MPHNNNFQHAKYSRSNPVDRVLYPEFQEGQSVASPEWLTAFGESIDQMMEARVRGVLFVSGNPYFDLFGTGRLDEVGGLKRGYSRGIPGIESLLSLLRQDSNGIEDSPEPVAPILRNDPECWGKMDRAALDVGNFSSAYIQTFQKAAHNKVQGALPVSRYLWSNINHHYGRVLAALDLLEYIEKWAQELSLSPDERLLIHAHGHAGQVLGILSNLVTSEESTNRQILFQVLAAHHERTQDPDVHPDRLEHIYQRLTERQFLGGALLDIVTYGTPVRGGWDTSGIGKLLHIVNHRPIRGDGKKWLAKMELPQIAWEIPMLSGGDYVQQLAVAGTDHSLDSSDQELVNQEIREILEPYDGFERWLECARRGTRCQNDGICLLVDYQVSGEDSPRTHLFGHGCYSKQSAMLFNAMQTVQQFYL